MSEQKSFFAEVGARISWLFSLRDDQARYHEVSESIAKGVEFRGTNLWTLIFAIFIASVGLDVNSTAAIIGAMLISPLMGPIMGLGLGVGIIDFELVKKSFRNLAIAVFISILTSTLYFLVSPLSEAQSELLARTHPSIWDVIIALAGGLAGIIGVTRREKSNVIPGVAIATALMPPLCTAGYGIAHLDIQFIFGAFYLFFINAVLISFSTYLIVASLHFPRKEFVDAILERRVKRTIWVVVGFTILPSLFFAYRIVVRTILDQNARRFIKTEMVFQETQVLSHQIVFDKTQPVISVLLFGKVLNDSVINSLEDKKKYHHLENVRLDLRQNREEEQKVDLTAIRTGVLEDLVRRNERTIRDKDSLISVLRSRLLQIEQTKLPEDPMFEELMAQNEKVNFFSLNRSTVYSPGDSMPDTMVVAVVGFKSRQSGNELKRIENWLRVRSKADSLVMITK